MQLLASIRRLLVTALWTVGALLAWGLLLYFGGLFLVHWQQQYHWQPLGKWMPEWAFWTVFYGGTILALAGPAMLGLLGYLPGTSGRRHLPRTGFPIDPAPSVPSHV
jgi:hypothetical protein